MSQKISSFAIIVVACAFALAGYFGFSFTRGAQAQDDARLKREQLYRLNNIGVAFMEQFKHEDAVKQFKQALERDPNFAVARINLALAYYYLNDSRAAVEEARAGVKLAPDSPNAHYALAAALRNEKLYDEALAEFNKVLSIDPRDSATNIQIGQLHAQKQQYPQAIAAFQRAIESEPYNATAVYSLAQAMIRSGQAAEGRKALDRFQQLQASGYKTTLGNLYGEKGRYAEAVVSAGAEPDLVSKEAPNVRFAEAGAGVNVKTSVKPLTGALGRKIGKAEFNDQLKRDLVAPFSSSLALADFDGDGRLDLFVSGVDDAGKPFVKLLRNEGGKFSDVTEKSKITAENPVSGAVFGDFDNDGKTDLAIFGYQTLALWRNNGDGSFSDVTAKSGLPAKPASWALTAAWVDADHDGDLDLFVGNFADLSQFPNKDSAVFPDDFAGEENKLYRNNGNGSFTDITAQTGLGGGKNKTTAVVATDYNNQRDIDFLVVNYGSPVQLFSNQRDGSFKEVAEQVGLKFSGRTLGVAAGDINKDGFTDFYFNTVFVKSDGNQISELPALYLSDGKGGFKSAFAGPVSGRVPFGAVAQFADYDNDGLLDILIGASGSVLGARNTGEYKAMPSADLLTGTLENRAFASGDINGDGAIDLIVTKADGSIAAFRNEGASKNYVAIALTGKTSNRSAVGTKAELRSGSLRQKLEVYASSPAPAASGLIFGLGYRTEVDSLRLLWPSGVLQSELSVKPSATNAFEELDRKGTSCPILYTWNGSRYEFVTDFLGGCAIGAREPGNTWSYPDTDEYVRVTGDQLKERDGVYSMLMNDQLEEVIYFDAVKLLAVDHPAGVEIYPNERLMPGPPYPEFKIYATQNARPPVKAFDDKGADILPLIKDIDRRYPEDFDNLKFKGYAKEHAITLDLGEIRRRDRVVLLLTAWIDYADSTSNMAAAQAGATITPPYLQVKNARGEWQTVIPQMGFPAGLPKTMAVDLTGKFLCDDSQVRIVTSMRIYWDQILVDVSGGDFPTRVTKLDPMRADLRWRGFPREYSPDGRKPLIYDYSVIEPLAPWKAHLGNYTRFGDVRELLLAPDDMYVITRNGDEMQIDFDARRMPALPKGWKRTFLVYADGFGKDMDINSARPETIGELPFHGMKSYPYSSADCYPITKRHQEYLLRYNTRTVNEQTQAFWRGVK
ncbi:MAG TPA: FG-GAP-like repeat-containing protein [Blastocatellia bacterium]|jgi:tetratricopeptide (TPR) repeat protein|nr:FG-GAP-like repeat-containing protein [Blastocatellia bacterium]